MTPLQTSPLPVKRSPVLREFSSIERMHWLMDQNHCNHFPMAAEISGHTTVAMWRNALNDLQRRHPLLNVFIGIEDNSRPVFYQGGEYKIPLLVRNELRHCSGKQSSKKRSPRLSIHPNHHSCEPSSAG